jgi:cysteine-rich repeat protein
MLRFTLSRSARTLTAATAFIFSMATSATAQDTCDVVAHLDATGPFGIVAFGIDYSAAGGDFIGDSTSPNLDTSWGTEPLACTPLVLVDEYTGLDDNAGLLSNFLADFSSSLSGPAPLTSCVFAPAGGFPCPAPSDFSIVEVSFPDDPFPPPIAFPPPPAMSITVSPRTPVCGDGFEEGTEECDDGNTVDGDCCSSTCTLDAESTPCDDGSVCTGDETCDADGSCVVGSTVDCDDGVMCTHDFCDDALGCQAVIEPTPGSSNGCDHLTKLKLDIRDHETNDTADRVKLNAQLHTGNLGDPTANTDYALCIFDRVGNVYTNVMQLDIPSGSPWALRGGSGSFGYIDGGGVNDGVKKIRLKQNKKGKGKLLLIGKDLNLPLPGPFDIDSYMADDPNTAIQVENSDGQCWSETLGPPLKNDADRFKVKE